LSKEFSQNSRSKDRDTLRRALPYPTFDIPEPEKPQTELTNFTTEPKTRRHLTLNAFVSLNRASDFMQHLWSLKLRRCSYSTLEFEFINYFGTNEKRTLERYLGRPPQKRLWKGNTLRQNVTSGRTAFFRFDNQRELERMKGLLEILGYITLEPEVIEFTEGTISLSKKTKNWIVILHHERMRYYTEQSTLEVGIPLPECESSNESSILDARVCSLLVENNDQDILQGKGNGETVLEVSPIEPDTTTNGEREREDIDSTHTNVLKPQCNRNDDKLERALGHLPPQKDDPG